MSDKVVKRFRIGLLSASIWKNEGTEKPFYNVELQRSYKKEDGTWENTSSLSHADLLNASKLLQRAETWVADQ